MMGKWQSYRHRFLPWLFLNWSTRQVKHSKTCLDPAQEKTVLSQLTSLLNQLDIALPQYSVKEYRQLLKREGELRDLQERGREVLRKEFGFSLEVCTSHLKEGGKGVIVTDGRVPSGHLVGLYPGTVYMPYEPLLLQSLHNPFIFRCADGTLIDGNHRGLSKWIYKSCAYRDVVGGTMACDVTWLSLFPSNPLAIGQFVNNHTRDIPNNVEYVEVVIPRHHVQRYHWRLLPNVYYSTPPAELENDNGDSMAAMRCVVLVSTGVIDPGTEFYSSYLTLVAHT